MGTARRWGMSAGALIVGGIGLGLPAGPAPGYGGSLPVGTTLEDFFMPGTQPDPSGSIISPFIRAVDECVVCHGNFPGWGLPQDAEPFHNWMGSMMAQAARDPVAWAAITVANQDAADGGDLCLRCHTPAGWLGGRSVPTDGSGLLPYTADFEGVTCHVCHRLVNPVYVEGQSPPDDLEILGDLEEIPAQPGAARYVVDPQDRRRGPYDLVENFPFHDWRRSPFHKTAQLCATCHDVENPQYLLQSDGSYAFTAVDTQHPTMDKYQMFPIERTFSEWSQSDFANGGVQMNGRFGGAHPTGVMETCQDCHMPDQVSRGCISVNYSTVHDDMPSHFLNGGNTWVIRAVDTLYSDGDPPDDPPDSYNDPVYTDDPGFSLTPAIIAGSVDRATQMLRDASDMELCQTGNRLGVRVINMSGHKLPTGYPEGRRMWISVRFFDAKEELLQEYGHYDFETADLTHDTKVYETRLGLDAAAAAVTGLPAGESFHFILNNSILKDNRIPPMGFTNAAFSAIQAAPVAHSYADGQYWDDTSYAIPSGAVEAVATLYYQTTSKDYIEFLRDENTTDSRGQIAYDQWVLHGKSAPVDMDSVAIVLDPPKAGDLDGNGTVNVTDLLILLGNYGPCPAPCEPCCEGDTDGNCAVDFTDLLRVLSNWTW